MAGGVPGLGGLVRVRPEVLEGRVREAIDLGVVAESALLGKRDGSWERDPWGFLERTHVTGGMRRTVKTVFAGLAAMPEMLGEPAARVVVLPSLLGGGKTHLLAFLLYVVALLREEGPGSLERVDSEVARAARALAERVPPGDVRIAVVAGDTRSFAPRPGMPVEGPGGWRAQTLWGFVLGMLGVPWELWKRHDESETVPGKDELAEMIGDRPALIVIDEITSYASSLPPERRDQVVTFLKHLFEAADRLPRTVVVVTLPARVSARTLAVEAKEHDVHLASGASLIEEVYRMAQRASHRVIPPLDMEADLASVLRRRLIASSEEELRRAASTVRALFESIKSPELERAARLARGSWERFLEELEESFPFHPLYLMVLRDIGTHVPGFQRTRSLLKLTAGILRGVDRMGEPVVMPWHIDVSNDTVRALLLAQHEKRDYYDRVVREDLERLEEAIEDPAEREAARRLIAVVWLYSIALGALLNVARMLEQAPTVEALPAYVVEPAGAARGVTASTVLNAAEDLARQPGMHITMMEGRKLLYPYLPDVEALIRRAYHTAPADAAYHELEAIAVAIEKSRGSRLRAVSTIVRGLPPVLEKAVSWLREDEDPRLLVLLDPQTGSDTLAGALPKNNTFLLAPEFDAPASRAGAAAQYIERHYPYAGRPGTLWELLVTLARLRSAIRRAREELSHMDIDKPVLRSLEEKLSSADQGLSGWIGRVLEAALRVLYGGSRGKEKWSIDLGGLLTTYGGSKGEPFQLAPALEEYMKSSLGVPDRPDLEMVVRTARVLGRTRTEPIMGEPTEIIAEPLAVRDLWRYLLESVDRHATPHLMTRDSFADGLAEAYRQEGASPQLAFILERADGARRVLWLKPLPLGDQPECYLAMIERWYTNEELLGEIQVFLRSSYRSLGEALMEATIVHPIIAVEDYVRGLLADESRARRRGEAELRRKYYLVRCGRGGEAVELSRLYGILRGNPGKLYEELAGGYVAYREIIVEKSYSAAVEAPGEELVYEAGSGASVRITVRLESHDYPAPVEIIARVTDAATGQPVLGGEVVRIANQARRRQLSETVVLEVPVPGEPGEYVVDVYTKGLYQGDHQEIHRATVKLLVKGERCASLQAGLDALKEHVEGADRWRVTAIRVSLDHTAPPAALQHGVMELLRRLLRSRARVSVEAVAAADGEEIAVRLSNAAPQRAGRLLQTFIDIARDTGARLVRLTLEARLEEPPWGTLPIDIPGPIKDSTTLTVEKCFSIK